MGVARWTSRWVGNQPIEVWRSGIANDEHIPLNKLKQKHFEDVNKNVQIKPLTPLGLSKHFQYDYVEEKSETV
jgi:hypothetical protein